MRLITKETDVGRVTGSNTWNLYEDLSNDRYPSDWDSRRKKVYRRDDYKCQNCGDEGGPNGDIELHAHHIVPKSEGGSDNLSNLATLCYECHNAVHDHHIPRQTDKGGHEESASERNKTSTNHTRDDAETGTVDGTQSDVDDTGTDSEDGSGVTFDGGLTVRFWHTLAAVVVSLALAYFMPTVVTMMLLVCSIITPILFITLFIGREFGRATGARE